MLDPIRFSFRSHLRRGWAEVFFSLCVEVVISGDIGFPVHFFKRRCFYEVCRLHPFRQNAMACDTQICDGRVNEVPRTP
jgi:hypothetical protein